MHPANVPTDRQAIGEFRAYLVGHPRGYARATITKRVAAVRRYVHDVPGWRTVHPIEIERWAATLGVSTSATRDYLSHVRAFYRYCNRAGILERDPTAGVDMPRRRRRLPRPARDLDILTAVAGAGPMMRAMLVLMAGCGLRCCEVAGLRWSDVDLFAGTIHVTGKGGRERVLEISPDVARCLLAVDRPGPYVFVSVSGHPYTAARVSQIVNDYLRHCGAGFTAHQLRHRFATAALQACGRVDVVRDLLGHSSVATTEIYAQITPGLAGPVARAIHVPGV
jgi:integrase/recombinase XerC